MNKNEFLRFASDFTDLSVPGPPKNHKYNLIFNISTISSKSC